ncbi:MAG TPA: hypothetical protein PKI03_10845 [Pseudomonadota bacterium]|nr:hypothetical protein [Pseudomonadota bacterium]
MEDTEMAEKVVKLGVKREAGYLYFLRGSDVWKTPMKRAGAAAVAGKAEKVQAGNFAREEGFLYFLDAQGDISRAKRAVGGQKRKKPKTEKKAPAKKAAKPAAKKAAPAKKAPAKKAAAPAKKAPAKKAPAKPVKKKK